MPTGKLEDAFVQLWPLGAHGTQKAAQDVVSRRPTVLLCGNRSASNQHVAVLRQLHRRWPAGLHSRWHGSVRLLQSPVSDDRLCMPTKMRSLDRRVVASCVADESLAGQVAMQSSSAARVAGGEVRGCCTQPAVCPTPMHPREADAVSRVRWNGGSAAAVSAAR